MKNMIVLAVVAAVCVPSAVLAQKAATAPAASAPATTRVATAPAGEVLAIVGDVKITSGKIDAIIAANMSEGAPLPPKMLSAIRQQLVNRSIMLELAKAYIATQKVQATPEEIAKEKDDIAKAAAQSNKSVEQFMADNDITDEAIVSQIRLRKLTEENTTKEKLAAFVKANPNYFNGTKIHASHILMKVQPTASSQELKNARGKLEAIAADIKAGKISFADAAKTYSGCPSGIQGGDLGEWTYDGQDPAMDPVFSKAAFATKVGEMSPIIRTSAGFHLIKVTNITEGKAAPAEDAEETARGGIISELYANILDMPLTKVTVTTMPALTQPASEPASATAPSK